MKANLSTTKIRKIYKNRKGNRKEKKYRKENGESSSYDESPFEFHHEYHEHYEQRVPLWASYSHSIDKWEEESECQSNNSVLADIDEESVNERFIEIKSLFPEEVLGTSDEG